MSLFDCIGAAVRAGEMNEARGEAAQALFEELRDRYARQYGADQADAMAAADVRRIVRDRTAHKRRVMLAQIQAQRRLGAEMADYRNLIGENDHADALASFLEYDQAARHPNVSSTRMALRGRFHAMIADFLEQHGRDVTGRVRNIARLPDIARELHGVETGVPEAAEMAAAIREAFEAARTAFNAAGGNIGKLDDFGVPHSHNARAIRSAGFDVWLAEIGPRLDWNRIIDHETGEAMSASTEGRQRAFLREIFEAITTDGWSRREANFQTGRGAALYNRRADHRILHFRNADDWLAYNESFGQGSVFEAVIAHLDGLARDTALMRVLGPNPKAGFEFLVQTAEKAATTQPWKLGAFNRIGFSDPVNKVSAKAVTARTMLGLITGEANRPGNEMVANFLSGTRHFLVATRLGAAMLSAVTDVGFQRMAGRHLGMGASRIMGRQLRLLARDGNRRHARRLGVVADQLANVGAVQARYLGEQQAPALAERLSEFTMRASGLSGWTEAGRHAFQLEMFGFLAEHGDREWSDLPDELRDLLLDARGFDADDWDLIRSTPRHVDQETGADFIVPDMIRHRTDIEPERAEGLATRLMAAISEQAEFAVPSASLRGRATLDGGRPGTLFGEVSRSGLMFKSFALSVLFNQLRRVAYAPINGSRVNRILAFAAMTTAAGAMSLQLKEIAKGRDPQPMTSDRFWQAALLQGGGLGIFGDFLSSQQSRFGGGFAQTLAGPGVGLAEDIADLTGSIVGDAHRLMEGDDPKAGRELANFARYNTPVVNLWYVSLVAQRGIFDNLQRGLDPNAEAAWRRLERRRTREFGNPSFYGPGDRAPRAPDFSNIFEVQQ